ncbi:MAG: hypothetical protein ACXWLR_07860 [Myxococcales bacterium]
MLALMAAAALLPVNPFLHARAGDWWVLESRDESGSHRVKWEIVRIAGDTIHLRLRDQAGQEAPTSTSRSAPLLALYDLDAPSPIPISDEECAFGNGKLHCKKLDYRIKGLQVTAYFSDEVKGGLISASNSGSFGSNSTRLVAYGTAKTVEFGAAP